METKQLLYSRPVCTDSPCTLVLKDDHRRLRITVDAEIVSGVDRHVVVVVAVQVDDADGRKAAGG